MDTNPEKKMERPVDFIVRSQDKEGKKPGKTKIPETVAPEPCLLSAQASLHLPNHVSAQSNFTCSLEHTSGSSPSPSSSTSLPNSQKNSLIQESLSGEYCPDTCWKKS